MAFYSKWKGILDGIGIRYWVLGFRSINMYHHSLLPIDYWLLIIGYSPSSEHYQKELLFSNDKLIIVY